RKGYAESPASVAKSFREIAVSVDPAVAQKWPVSAGHINFGEVDGMKQNFLLIHAGFRENLAAGPRNETLSPEFQAVAARRHFRTDTIDRSNVATVGHGMAALD